MPPQHDVIVVGAGPAGSTTAHYLAQSGLNVLLLDKSGFPRDKACGDGLPPRSLPVLDDMGLLDTIRERGLRLNTFAVTAPSGWRISVPLPKMAHAPSYILVLPRLILDDLIRQRAVQSGAQFVPDAHVVDVASDDEGVTVTVSMDGGEQVTHRARMAVIATGAATKLLTTMGVLQQPPDMVLAARAYYENVRDLDQVFHFLFAGVPLPGYGWIFPTSPTSVNVGAGYRSRPGKPGQPASPAAALEAFTHSRVVGQILKGAHQVGAVKGYPLRGDFARAKTFVNRVLLVGEAAGLVNPLTGDGIDYALESGQTAARHIAGMFAAGDFSAARHQAYDAALRAEYQNLFLFCEEMRDWFMNRVSMNTLIPMGSVFPKMAAAMTLIVLGGLPVPDNIPYANLVVKTAAEL